MAHDDPHHFEDIHQALHRHLPSEPALRVKALESLLIEKGMLDPKAVDAWIAVYTEEIGPKRGATMVAKAWLDPDFRARLLADGTAAISELGFEGWAGAHQGRREHAGDPQYGGLHLCSYYPHAVLGIPPNWYKTAAYRARAVRDPRGVLAEFGEIILDNVAIRVWDSTSSCATWCCPNARPAPRAGARLTSRAWSPATR